VEGRVAVEYFSEAPEVQAKKFAFKCHRRAVEGVDVVYPVNAIAFHARRTSTFATGGCDGSVITWDGAQRKRIATVRSKCPSSVAAMAMSPGDSSLLAVASSYTYENGEPTTAAARAPDRIFIHKLTDAEVGCSRP
jgi:cell cycle arrest protein BUB3